MKKTFLLFILTTTQICFVLGQCVECDPNSSASGNFSTALGQQTTANGNASFASGAFSQALGSASSTIGFRNLAEGDYSFAIGSFTHSSVINSFAFGIGYSETKKLINNTSYSLILGFNSDKPTLFIGKSDSYGKTGKIAIGNVDNGSGYIVPQAKLHIRADDEESASFFIEPNNWNAGEEAIIMLGDINHIIRADKNIGIEFKSVNNFIFSGNNSGFGVEEPKAKVHINGDLLFENNLNGIIMKSEDGNCWKGTISNNGELIFSQVDCETLTATQNIIEPKHSEVFIYPNPTNGQMTVEYTGNRKNLRLEVKSISGLLVATYKINKGENRIELNNISDQMIVASVFTKKGELISTNKVVIQK